MQMSFRWFGARDPVSLSTIRQVPGVEGIVSALHGVPAGEAWSMDAMSGLAEAIDAAGFRFAVVESIPIHDDIKLGRPSRDGLIERFCESLRVVGRVGVPVVCYNFMPVLDWTRTRVDMPLGDGSTTLSYDPVLLASLDPVRGPAALPAWFPPDPSALPGLLADFRRMDDEALWENLEYFLSAVVPVAEESGVKMALHPDDPPWSVFGLPRIVTDGAALERVLRLVDRPANGITFCTGSLGADPANDLPGMIRGLGTRIHFAHCRNVKVTGPKCFHETPHPSRFGGVDLLEVFRALRDVGFDGPVRPDHGRMIWGETGQPGYGLHDRALGAAYLQGLWEGIGGRDGSRRRGGDQPGRDGREGGEGRDGADDR